MIKKILKSWKVHQLVQQLEYVSDWKREKVVEALGALGDPRAIKPLVALLHNDKSWFLRFRVVEALERIGWKPANVTEAAVAAVAKRDLNAAASVGDAAIECLLSYHAFRLDEWWPVEAIRRIGSSRATETLHGMVERFASILKDGKDERERLSAARALGIIGDTRAIEALSVGLKDRYVSVGKAAGAELATIGNPAVQTLIVTLNDDEALARMQAAEALGKIHDDRVVEALVTALKDKHSGVRSVVVKTLRGIGWKPSDPAERALESVALGNWKDVEAIGEAAIEPLTIAVMDEDFHICYEAVKLLRRIDDARVVRVLDDIVSKGHKAQILWEAVGGLAAIGDERCIPTLLAELLEGSRGREVSYYGRLTDALNVILNRCAAHVETGMLQKIASLENFSRVVRFHNSYEMQDSLDNATVDVSQLSHFAREELTKRGEKLDI